MRERGSHRDATRLKGTDPIAGGLHLYSNARWAIWNLQVARL